MLQKERANTYDYTGAVKVNYDILLSLPFRSLSIFLSPFHQLAPRGEQGDVTRLPYFHRISTWLRPAQALMDGREMWSE